MSGTPPYRLKKPEPLEAQVLKGVLRALELHPRVAKAWRMNTGGAYLAGHGGKGQFVRFGFVGSPDIYGYLTDGRALYVEVKRPSGTLKPEQAAFLATARGHGCIAFVARSSDDVFAHLEAA